MTVRFTRGVSLLLCMGVTMAWTCEAGPNTIFNFLRNDVGARAAALAGSFVTVTDDPTAVFYNPASGGTLDTPRGSLGFLKQILDINSGHVVYGQDVEDFGSITGGILFTHYGSFTETDETGTELGSFSAADIAVSLTYSNTFSEHLYYGATAKFIYSAIADYSSTGLAADIGLLYRIPDSRASVGASLRNMGVQTSTYRGTNEDLPLDLSIGGSVVPRGIPLLLNLNFHRLNESAGSFGDRFRWFTVGAEFTLSSALQLRFGYDNARRKDLKIGTSAGLAGFTAGLGLTVSDYRIDYGINLLGEIGALHQISIAASF
ncbi:MAG: type IX secretion system protein PorQ [Bacteroidota bacterium]